MSERVQIDMSHMDSVVEVRHLTKTFSQWQRDQSGKGMLRNLIHPEKRTINALSDVSFTVKRGEFVAYAGPNGAGKSTTMKLLGGMLMPNEGNIGVLGYSPQKQRVPLMNRLGILFGNRTELWWDHPVRQSFEWKKVVWGIPDDVYKRNFGIAVELLGIGGLLKTFTRELSLGQRMRCDLAMLLLHSPELLLLDEPTLGLDVVAKRQMIDFLKKINRDDNVTIMVTSHDMDDLEEMARRVLMIADGKIAFDGDFNGLREITGNLSRVRVSVNDESCALLLSEGRLLSHERGVFEYEVDFAKTSVQALLKQLSQSSNVRDLEIQKAPIEQVIAQLYKRWA